MRIFFLLLLNIHLVVQAQNIETIAGRLQGYDGDGGLAINAKLNMPRDVAFDSHGNLFIADELNYVIRKIDTSGIISTYAGNGVWGYSGDGGSAKLAQIGEPYTIVIDKFDNLYIGGRFKKYVIRKVDKHGIISTVAGNGEEGFSGDGGPAILAKLNNYCYGLAVDTSANLYISDGLNHCIRKVDTLGIITTIAGIGNCPGYWGDGNPAALSNLWYPWDIAFDKKGNLFIVDGDNYVIRKVNTDGIISTFANVVSSNIVMDSYGNLYYSGGSFIGIIDINGKNSILAGTGVLGYNGDFGIANTIKLNHAAGITIDAHNNIFIADHDNNCIRKVSGISLLTDIKKNNSLKLDGKVIFDQNSNKLYLTNFLQESKVEIIDIMGVKLFSCNNNLQNYELDLNWLNNGEYIIRFTSNSQTNIKKIIKYQ